MRNKPLAAMNVNQRLAIASDLRSVQPMMGVDLESPDYTTLFSLMNLCTKGKMFSLSAIHSACATETSP